MNNEVRCPHCGQVFKVDETNYVSIVNQIKTHEFEEELKRRLKDQVDLVKTEAKSNYESKLNDKETEFLNLKQAQELDLINKNNKIESLENELKNLKENSKNELESEKLKVKNDYQEELNKYKLELERLNEKLAQNECHKNDEITIKVNEITMKKDGEINSLKSQLELKEATIDSLVDKAKSEKDMKINELLLDLEKTKNEAKAKEETLINKYKGDIENLNEQLQMAKDFKMRQSTKAIGESLEIYCHNEFNKQRAYAYPRAYFDKDNEISESGSKGDFIFRDYVDLDGEKLEYVSIMFEMKNEADKTEKKHKNEDFLRELDKDRREKGCEYAILVSMLEADNDYYNSGIVDMSHLYPNMYVIRPQFFMPIIGLIVSEARKTINYKKELEIAKNEDLDFTNFEKNMAEFKEKFGKNYDSAHKQFETSIAEIDKSISHLQKVRDSLTSCDRQLRLANDKAQDLTVKKITKNAPSIYKKIEEAKPTN